MRLILLMTIFINFSACAAGGKRPQFSDFPDRDNAHSLWKFASSNQLMVNKCTRWKNDNTCLEEVEKTLPTEAASSMGMLCLTPETLRELIGEGAMVLP